MSNILDRRRYYYDTPTGEYVTVITVLVAGMIGDYAAYRGCIVNEGYSEEIFAFNEGWVANHGNKISFDEALALFPYIEKSKWRR